MAKYTWIKYTDNPNNIVYALRDNATGKNVASMGENNYCDYTIFADNPMADCRTRSTLEEVKEMILKKKSIDPEDVEDGIHTVK